MAWARSQPHVTTGPHFIVRANTDYHYLLWKGTSRAEHPPRAHPVLAHLFFSGPYGLRMTNSKLQIQKSKAKGGEATCPNSHRNYCQLAVGPVGLSHSQNQLEDERSHSPPQLCPIPVRNPTCPTRASALHLYNGRQRLRSSMALWAPSVTRL